jgi:multiple sugar transport system ATP-binding protein
MVAGLERPDAGRVLIGERDMTAVAPQDRDLAMVFQGFALYPHMRVRDIMAFPLKMRRVNGPERARLVGDAAELLGITRLLDRRPAELSGGEQQRVAMGRAIVRRPEVFLFDEPLSNLDAALRTELRVELGKLLRRLEATALYVTHDQTEAMTLSDRIALLRDGRIEQLASPRDIYERPATAFVARFFGAPAMNVLTVDSHDKFARLGDLSVPSAPRDGKLLLGIRPENVAVSRQPEAGAAAKVIVREPHGAETHLELEIAGQTLRARVAGFDAPVPGDTVWISVEAGAVRWFDATTERAI